MGRTCDFSGWATKNNLKCTDGRTIMKDAFKHNDGRKVPLVWNHQHHTPENVIGHAILENRDEGVYAYGYLNDTRMGNEVRKILTHGDIEALSIAANRLKHGGSGRDVFYGDIYELSLVLAGANPGAFIDYVITHGDDSDEEAVIYTGEGISLYHSDEEEEVDELNKDVDADDLEEDDEGDAGEEDLTHADSAKKDENASKEDKKEDTVSTEPEKKTDGDKTVKEVWEGILDKTTEEEQTVIYAMIGQALEDAGDDNEEENDMKHNVFDQEEVKKGNVLTHSDQESIIKMAKGSNVGSLQAAINMYAEQNESLKHGIDDIELLFPEYKDVRPGAPELIERDQTWVGHVMQKTHKSPISRIRTRQADARGNDLRAHGYQKKGDEKTLSGNIKLMGRTTDPQTVYRKDALHRDDIIDITDFSVPEYMYGIMRRNLLEDIALATMVGDLREDGDPDKIHEEHIRPIWKDDELYCIHYDVDVEAMRKELQGSDTGVYFGENYIYAEAVVNATLYSREQYKGSGNPEFYCDPHILNVMLLARDRNGRRIYDSKADLAKALNVPAIHTAEQFAGLTRVADDGTTKKLLGIFVNLADYQHGSTKGGEITRFNQFDIDFNQEKYLIETRLSGALTRIKSAIALEEPVVEAAG